VDVTGSGSCPVADFYISGVETYAFADSELVNNMYARILVL
jgi:hypothetical protein